MKTDLQDIDEDVSYVTFKNDDGIVELWRISPITKKAEFLQQPQKLELRKELDKGEILWNSQNIVRPAIITPFKEYQNYYTSRTTKDTRHEGMRYITEFLIPKNFCEFERDGNVITFKHYDDDPLGVIMKTKECHTCGKEFIINMDQTNCMVHQ